MTIDGIPPHTGEIRSYTSFRSLVTPPPFEGRTPGDISASWVSGGRVANTICQSLVYHPESDPSHQIPANGSKVYDLKIETICEIDEFAKYAPLQQVVIEIHQPQFALVDPHSPKEVHLVYPFRLANRLSVY